MAINRLTIDGYASLELNRVAFPTTGRVVANLPLNSAFNTNLPAENGMILGVDYAGGEVTLPGSGMVGIHFSTEKEYDPQASGLKNFKLVSGGEYPRIGLLAVGDRFTTNAICYNTATFANNAVALAAFANYATTALYGYPEATTGAILVTTTAPTTEKTALQVIDYTTVPNGDVGLKFVVVAAQ